MLFMLAKAAPPVGRNRLPNASLLTKNILHLLPNLSYQKYLDP